MSHVIFSIRTSECLELNGRFRYLIDLNDRTVSGAHVCRYLDFEAMTSLHPSRAEVLSCGFPSSRAEKKLDSLIFSMSESNVNKGNNENRMPTLQMNGKINKKFEKPIQSDSVKTELTNNND